MEKRDKKLIAVSLFLFFMGMMLIGKMDQDNTDTGKADIIKTDTVKTDESKASESLPVDNRTIDKVVEQVLNDFQIDANQVSITYYDLKNDDHYALNEDKVTYAASTTKVVIAMLFADLIEAGNLTWDSELPYYDAYYEEGDGDITNMEKRAAYPVEELVYQMLTYSDNTATNILAFYYIDNYEDYWQALKRMSGLEVTDPQLIEDNYSTTNIMAHTLMRLVENDKYEKIVAIMQEAQEGFRLKKYIDCTMAAKYGSYDDYEHDIGVCFNGDEPEYILAVYTQGVAEADEFLGQLSLQINEWRNKKNN